MHPGRDSSPGSEVGRRDEVITPLCSLRGLRFKRLTRNASGTEVSVIPIGYRRGLRDLGGCDSLVFAKTTGTLHGLDRDTRRKYRREGLRYASDTTDAAWAVIEPHMPPPATCGRPRQASLREVVNAIFYIAQTGCQWRMLPSDFPPFTTVQRYFYWWPVNARKGARLNTPATSRACRSAPAIARSPMGLAMLHFPQSSRNGSHGDHLRSWARERNHHTRHAAHCGFALRHSARGPLIGTRNWYGANRTSRQVRAFHCIMQGRRRSPWEATRTDTAR
jgi:transposase